MDKAREKFVAEIKRMESAAGDTKSKYLRRDYLKAVHRMKLELQEYDAFKKSSNL